ncbi:hypothetical protein NST17_19925 [Caldifermentibacillus hisashii]|uniref:HNH endonuclease n=1 Tax=Caldifermentibacillus hisashii TaxID=996558 RepID=A0ABU9K2U2_9BACI
MGNINKIIMIDNVQCKQCSKCKTIKPLDDFYRFNKGLGGRKSACKQCTKETDRVYREKHKEYYIEKNKYNNEYQKKWREANKEKERIRLKKWREENKEKYKIINKANKQRRKAMRKLLVSTVSKDDIESMLNHFQNKCSLSNERKNLHIDHFIALSTGHCGSYIGNLIPLSAELNISKRDENPFEWIKTRNDIDENKFNNVVKYLADLNGLNTNEYKEFVYWCYNNQRSIDDIKKDGSSLFNVEKTGYQCP